MSVDGWNTLLVLGGTRSGKSRFAESLVGDLLAVRHVVTSPAAGSDDDRPAVDDTRRDGWTFEKVTADPAELIRVISEAGPDETLLVDDLGGWVELLIDPAHQPADDRATIAELATAVRDCPARLVLVSPEVGLALPPETPLGRAVTDALGTTNQAVADACDAVVLVVAGQPSWLKPGAPLRTATVPVQSGRPTPTVLTTPVEPSPPVVVPVVSAPTPTAPAREPATAPWSAPTMALPVVATGLVIQPGMELPMPDDSTAAQAVARLAGRDVPGLGFGELERLVSFAGGTQGTGNPTAWDAIRVLLLHGDHSGAAQAGTVPGESARRAEQARAGAGPLAQLAAECGATLQVVDTPAAAPMEHGPALTTAAVDVALQRGWQLAEEAAEAGVRLLVIAACGAGSDTAAAAVLAATAGAEAPAVLGRVVAPGGQVDDAAWMLRCAAVRDALHRTRRAPRHAKDVLAELAGGDIAVATGILLGAAARRVPVLLDGPVGVAAGLVSRELAGQTRHWCLLPDYGRHPAVRVAADVLGLNPLFDLRLDLGEGANALATVPLLRSVLGLASRLRSHPTLGGDGEPDENTTPEFAEPEPAGPGPTSTDPTDGQPTPDDEQQTDRPGTTG